MFHNSKLFGSCIIHILYIGCAKIKKKFQRQKVKELLASQERLSSMESVSWPVIWFGWLAGWLVGWLVGRLVGWLVGWLVGSLVRSLVSQSAVQSWFILEDV